MRQSDDDAVGKPAAEARGVAVNQRVAGDNHEHDGCCQPESGEAEEEAQPTERLQFLRVAEPVPPRKVVAGRPDEREWNREEPEANNLVCVVDKFCLTAVVTFNKRNALGNKNVAVSKLGATLGGETRAKCVSGDSASPKSLGNEPADGAAQAYRQQPDDNELRQRMVGPDQLRRLREEDVRTSGSGGCP